MKTRIILATLTFALTACAPAANPVVLSTETPSIEETSTPIPFSEQLACWPVRPLEKGNDVKGSILFASLSDNESFFVWDVSSFDAHRLDYSAPSYSELAISHDGTSLTTLSAEKNAVIHITSTQTKTYLLDQSLPESKYYRNAWFLPNGMIAIRVGNKDESSMYYTPPESGYTFEYYLLDPVTGSLSPRSVLLPGFTLGPGVFLFPIEFSPDMQYVVYKSRSYDNGQYKFSLMNVKEQKVIWTGPSMPHWKADGSSLVYFDRGNLFSLTEDGKSVQMTGFEDGELFGIGPLYEEIPWSPDGRYVAFHRGYPQSIGLLSIWDEQSKKVFRPCLPDELRAYHNYFVYWSLDSRYLLITLGYPDKGSSEGRTSHYIDLILDMTNQIIYTLPEENKRGQYNLQAPKGAMIVGWVNWKVP